MIEPFAFFLLGILIGASGAMFITSMRSATKLAAKDTASDDRKFHGAETIECTAFETFVRETQR